MLCKNGDEEKKSLQKHFFDFEYFFFISNISFCKLLYHQIGGIGFDIFFSYFLSLCVLCDDVRSGAFLCNFNALFFLQGDPRQKLFINFAGTPCKSRVTFFLFFKACIISFPQSGSNLFQQRIEIFYTIILLTTPGAISWTRSGLFRSATAICSIVSMTSI